MQITAASSGMDKPTVTFHGRGIRGQARLVINAVEMPSVRTFSHDPIPALIAPYLTACFTDLHINGKDYGASQASYSPERPTGSYAQRKVLTDKGVQPVGYHTYVPYARFTDSARAKIAELMPLLADQYVTFETSKAALLAYTDDRVAAAKKALAAAQEDLDAAHRKQQSIDDIQPLDGHVKTTQPASSHTDDSEETTIGCALVILNADGHAVTNCPVCEGSHRAQSADSWTRQQQSKEHARG